MSDSSTSPGRGGNRNPKRNLPSWMSSRKNVSDHDRKKRASGGAPDESDEAEKPKQDKGGGKTNSKENQRSRQSSVSTSGATKFSKLLEGVVFVLSGFINPERSVLRSQALEMGAEYQADWNSNCTLLVCAFPNTPKFRQVESDCGTIVSKEWISECYNEKKLVDIELYLMHTGKPWRKQNISHEPIQDQELTASKKSHKHAEKSAYSNTTSMASSKGLACSSSNYHFPPSKVKKWAAEDFTKTITWLESQDEMPHPSEIKNIAAEGILTCLQDAIDSLKQEQEIQHISEQWNFVPRVIEELAKLEGSGDGSHSLPKKYLYKQAISCKEIYEKELDKLHDSSDSNKKMKTGEKEVRGSAKCDSDETIEMTEEDIDQAYNTVTSTLC